MTTISINYSYINTFESILLRHDGKANFIPLLKNQEKLKECLQELGWYTCGPYLGDHAVDIISNFAALSPEIINDYFRGNIELTDISRSLIKYIIEKEIKLVKDEVFSCIKGYLNSVDSTIEQLLNRRIPQHNINILGFGLDDGRYEKMLKAWLLNSKLAETVTLYGFDPISERNSDDIIMLTSCDLTKNDRPLFDVIIAKWVLHHIHPSERWDNFLQCINSVNTSANIIVVEEGLFHKKGDKTAMSLTYDLIFSFVDVIVNTALHPSWFNKNESNFYIDYLTLEDINELIGNSRIIRNFSAVHCGVDFFQQTIIFN